MTKPIRLDNEGIEYKKFKITKYLPIEEIQSTLVELVHLPTGATVMHIANDDPENLFCLSFQTLPNSSNGVAHILEHTVLCGSKKFPVKDPFFSMTRRSVNTFMNALTGSDFTCYPAASQVEKDFYNLLTVYLDAVFHPLLRHKSFLQEGHRLAFTNPDDINSSLMYKGVVFNEMKGAMSSTDDRLWHKILEKLFPNLPYRYNSGGEPRVILSLTHDELKEFHKYYYHPSHCLFFFYGNLPLHKHLDFIEKHALHGVKKKDLLPPVSFQERFSSSVHLTAYYPIAKDETTEKKAIHAFAFLTCPLSDQETTLSLSLIDSILSDTDASILKYALLQSGLCSQIDILLDNEMSEVPWVIICKGCDDDTRDQLYKIIQNTLQKVVHEKIDKKLIASSLHQLEFSRMEINSDFGPYGLHLFLRAALRQQQGAEAEKALQIHSLFSLLQEKLKDENYLPSLIKKYFLNNPHQVQLTFLPDKTLSDKEEQEQQQSLEKIEKKLTQENRQMIQEQAKQLLDYQVTLEKQSLDCLPKIAITDIPKTIKDYPLEQDSFNKINIYFHDTFTNHILYTDTLFSLPSLDKKDFGLLSLFTSIFTEMGTKTKSYQDVLQFMHHYLGSAHSYLSFNNLIDNVNHCLPSFCLRIKSLYRNKKHLFSFLNELIQEICFTDKTRLKELLLQIHTFLEHNLANASMRYANLLSQSNFSHRAFLENVTGGLDYYFYIKNLVKNIDDLDPLIADLEKMKKIILSSQQIDFVIGCDKTMYNSIKKENLPSLNLHHDSAFIPWNNEVIFPIIKSQARIISSPVSFNSFSFSSINYDHEEAPFLHLSSELMENLYLHKTIREKGGAYGSGARFNPIFGTFYFYSYRDPNISTSVDAFFESINIIKEEKFSITDLEEAKLGIIQGLDSPITPSHRAIVSYNWLKSKKTSQKRHLFKEKVLNTTINDIMKCAEHQLTSKDGILISFSGDDLLKKEKEKLKKYRLENILPM